MDLARLYHNDCTVSQCVPDSIDQLTLLLISDARVELYEALLLGDAVNPLITFCFILKIFKSVGELIPMLLHYCLVVWHGHYDRHAAQGIVKHLSCRVVCKLLAWHLVD